MIFRDKHTAGLPNAVLRHDAAHEWHRIYVAVSADNRTRIEYTVAAYLNTITQDCTNFLAPGFDTLVTIVNNCKRLIRLYVGCDRACTHMTLVAKNRIAYIVVMQHLHVIKQNDVLQVHELPTTQFALTSAAPRINAQWGTSVSESRLHDSLRQALGNILAVLHPTDAFCALFAFIGR